MKTFLLAPLCALMLFCTKMPAQNAYTSTIHLYRQLSGQSLNGVDFQLQTFEDDYQKVKKWPGQIFDFVMKTVVRGVIGIILFLLIVGAYYLAAGLLYLVTQTVCRVFNIKSPWGNS